MRVEYKLYSLPLFCILRELELLFDLACPLNDPQPLHFSFPHLTRFKKNLPVNIFQQMAWCPSCLS